MLNQRGHVSRPEIVDDLFAEDQQRAKPGFCEVAELLDAAAIRQVHLGRFAKGCLTDESEQNVATVLRLLVANWSKSPSTVIP